MPQEEFTFQKTDSPNSDLKILVCYNKPYTMPPLDDGILLPVQGGKAISQYDLGFQADNEVNGQPCDNISEKNDSYSEMSVMYWAWKNLKKLYPDVKYVGLFHYRRFFAFPNAPFTDTICKSESDIESYRINPQKVISILESGRIILPKKQNLPYSLMNQFCLSHASEDYRTTREVIRTKFPDYYDDFITVMEHSNKGSFLNMFIMKYEDFEKYCEWVFAVMSEVEPLIPYQHYNTYQKRTLGAITERLLNVYVRKNKLKPVYSSVYFYDKDVKPAGFLSSFGRFIFCVAKALRNDLLFMILTSNSINIKRRIKKLFSRSR